MLIEKKGGCVFFKQQQQQQKPRFRDGMEHAPALGCT